METEVKDDKVVVFGQVFTRSSMVKYMMSLIENNGMILEPSVGKGGFYVPLVESYGQEMVVGVEIDSAICPCGCLNQDFFSCCFDSTRFDTIIGNPPYVKYTNILDSTRKLLSEIPLNNLSNLYLYFMWRSIDLLKDGGELIFVVPRDFIKTTSSIPLNKRLYSEGGFTLFKEFGDNNTFDIASPNVAIIRWVKGGRHAISITEDGGFLSFYRDEHGIRVGDIFDVYVGAVSGNNAKYYSDDGNIEMVVSTTARNGKTVRAIYDDSSKWVRKPRNIVGRKVFVNSKTRNQHPFFIHDCSCWDGSVLCLKPKTDEYDIETLCVMLNSTNWDAQGFKVGGRLVFGQRNIQHAVLSEPRRNPLT